MHSVAQSLNAKLFNANIARVFPASQYMLCYVHAGDIRMPNKWRAYTRGPDRRPILEMLIVSIELADVSFA